MVWWFQLPQNTAESWYCIFCEQLLALSWRRDEQQIILSSLLVIMIMPNLTQYIQCVSGKKISNCSWQYVLSTLCDTIYREQKIIAFNWVSCTKRYQLTYIWFWRTPSPSTGALPLDPTEVHRPSYFVPPRILRNLKSWTPKYAHVYNYKRRAEAFACARKPLRMKPMPIDTCCVISGKRK